MDIEAALPSSAVAATTATVPPTRPEHARPTRPLLGRAPWWHRATEHLIRVLAFTAIAAIALIFVFLLKEVLPLFYDQALRSEVTFGKLWLAEHWTGYDQAEYIWQPVSDLAKFNIVPLLLGTLKVTVVSMLIAGPLGIAAAIYVSQFSPRWLQELVKPAIEVLAAIPSVVLGFFALIVMATWLQSSFGFESRLNATVAGIALALAVVPIVFTVSEEALRAVPRSYVEASTALGAARYQTVLRVVLPAAAPGIAAAIALGFGRAIGETMIVLMASGNASIVSLNLADSVRTLSATVAAELAEVVFGGAHYTVLFFIGAVLFALTLVINLVGGVAIHHLRRRLGSES